MTGKVFKKGMTPEEKKIAHRKYCLKYYNTHKDIILSKNKEYQTCEDCGGKYQKRGKPYHIKTQKHLMFSKFKDLEIHYNTHVFKERNGKLKKFTILNKNYII